MKDQHRGPEPIYTIERTGKVWKLLMLIGGLMILPGVAVTLLGVYQVSYRMAYAGVGLIVAGLLPWLAGKAGAWWRHA